MITVKEIYAECIVLHKDNALGTFVLLVKSPGEKWFFPRDKLLAGETVEDCALRALREKTGINAVLKKKVEDRIYWYSNKTKTGKPVRILKKIYFFLFEFVPSQAGSNLNIANAEWVAAPEALFILSNEGEKNTLKKCLA